MSGISARFIFVYLRNDKEKVIVLSEETKKELSKACKRLEEKNKQGKLYTDDYCAKVGKMSFAELAEELTKLLEEDGIKVNLDDIPEFDRAATPEEIAEEERKKNSYFNY